MRFKDYFSNQAAAYRHYRPQYPPALFEYLASLCLDHQQALDVATGSGQAALGLTRHFNTVFACEASQSQLENALAKDRLFYLNSTAEQLAFKSSQFDLLSVAQAAHWFVHDRFHAEANRLLKPQGVLAVWGYGLFNITAKIDAVIHDYYQHTVGDYWPPQRRWIEQHYAGLPFPYPLIKTRSFTINVSWDRQQLMGYLSTWSATQRYIADHQHDPLIALEQRLFSLWAETTQRKTIRWPIFLLAGRKP